VAKRPVADGRERICPVCHQALARYSPLTKRWECPCGWNDQFRQRRSVDEPIATIGRPIANEEEE